MGKTALAGPFEDLIDRVADTHQTAVVQGHLHRAILVAEEDWLRVIAALKLLGTSAVAEPGSPVPPLSEVVEMEAAAIGRQFIVALWKDEDGGYVVRCPMLEGCISQGETREEALANIREAIALCLEDEDEEDSIVPAGAEVLTVAC